MAYRLTKAAVLAYCREVFRDNPAEFRGDTVAQREFFNNYTDSLCRDRRITDTQYDSWTNPF
jgi:hypothetical protein